MTRTKDIFLTIAFLACSGYYTLLCIAFGSLSGESPAFYALSALGGLVLIAVSLSKKHKPEFAYTRFGGLSLTLPLIYFDIKHSYGFDFEPGELVAIITNLPNLVLMIYLTASIWCVSTLKSPQFGASMQR